MSNVIYYSVAPKRPAELVPIELDLTERVAKVMSISVDYRIVGAAKMELVRERTFRDDTSMIVWVRGGIPTKNSTVIFLIEDDQGAISEHHIVIGCIA